MHGILVNLPSSPSSEFEASDEVLLEQKIHHEPVFASVRKMSLQPSEYSSYPCTPGSHHAVLECPDLISNRHSSSPETVPQPRTPMDTPTLLPSSLVFVSRCPPPTILPMPVTRCQPVRSLEAMVVINLSQIKMLDELVRWGYQGGRRYWETLISYIAGIEHEYNGPNSIPTRFHLRLVGTRDYRFYNQYDFRYGLVNDFLKGLRIGAGCFDNERFILPEFDALGMNLIRSARPIDRIYLAKSAAAPLPLFSAHIPTVLLAAIGDEIYFDNNPHITRGLAVLSTEAWMMSLDGIPAIARLAHVVSTLAPQLQVPTWKAITSQAKPPIQIIRDWHDFSLLRHEGPATPCTSFYLKGECARATEGKCRYLHGEVAMEPAFLFKYRRYIASQPCKSGRRCKNRACLYMHTSQGPDGGATRF